VNAIGLIGAILVVINALNFFVIKSYLNKFGKFSMKFKIIE
jgi:hypothetical protein